MPCQKCLCGAEQLLFPLILLRHVGTLSSIMYAILQKTALSLHASQSRVRSADEYPIDPDLRTNLHRIIELLGTGIHTSLDLARVAIFIRQGYRA
mmetsp:Transcript_1059/g.1779  ORF Transcript_1059/g.1779 Transcript_1059/m.1779 type:complete len:95 (+) Transcript_1059:149-433(+)